MEAFTGSRTPAVKAAAQYVMSICAAHDALFGGNGEEVSVFIGSSDPSDATLVVPGPYSLSRLMWKEAFGTCRGGGMWTDPIRRQIRHLLQSQDLDDERLRPPLGFDAYMRSDNAGELVCSTPECRPSKAGALEVNAATNVHAVVAAVAAAVRKALPAEQGLNAIVMTYGMHVYDEALSLTRHGFLIRDSFPDGHPLSPVLGAVTEVYYTALFHTPKRIALRSLHEVYDKGENPITYTTRVKDACKGCTVICGNLFPSWSASSVKSLTSPYGVTMLAAASLEVLCDFSSVGTSRTADDLRTEVTGLCGAAVRETSTQWMRDKHLAEMGGIVTSLGFQPFAAGSSHASLMASAVLAAAHAVAALCIANRSRFTMFTTSVEDFDSTAVLRVLSYTWCARVVAVDFARRSLLCFDLRSMRWRAFVFRSGASPHDTAPPTATVELLSSIFYDKAPAEGDTHVVRTGSAEAEVFEVFFAALLCAKLHVLPYEALIDALRESFDAAPSRRLEAADREAVVEALVTFFAPVTTLPSADGEAHFILRNFGCSVFA